MKLTVRAWSVLVAVSLAVVGAVGGGVVLFNASNTPGNDFILRINEVDCLRHGVDPFDVWSGERDVAPYVSRATAIKDTSIPNARHVYAYVPWEYVFMLPFTLCERVTAWHFYMVLMLLLCVVVYVVVKRRGSSFIESAFPLLVVSYTLFSDLQVGNFGILALTSTCLMAFLLGKRHDALAGVCWAFVMFKPQLGIVFAVPLLWRRRYLTCVVAACSCLAVTVIPSLMCGKSPIKLLFAAPTANAEFFQGCGTWPYFLCGCFSSNVEIVFGLVLGLVLCLIMTAFIRQIDDWFVYMMPAAICACSWSYAHSYCYVLGWFLAFALIRELVHKPQSKFLWGMMVLAILSLSRWFLAWHGLYAQMGWTFPMSEYAFRCVDSLNSTLSLAIAGTFCIWKRRTMASG